MKTLVCAWCEDNKKRGTCITQFSAHVFTRGKTGDVYPYCSSHASAAVRRHGDDVIGCIADLPGLLDAFARQNPDLVMDEPEDSVPDVQMRAEDREVMARESTDKMRDRLCVQYGGPEPKKPSCKWHGVRLEHPVPKPDLCTDASGCRADVIRQGVYSDTSRQILEVEQRLSGEYMERVVTWIRNNFREMPSCGGNPVSIETKEDGHEYWLCLEHCHEEG